MITLELPPQVQSTIEQESQQAGMSVEQYIVSKLMPEQETQDNIPKSMQQAVGLLNNVDGVEFQNALRE